MRRMSDGAFIAAQPDMDDIYAIRIEDGKYYFLGWMENAEKYNIQIANHPENCLLDDLCFWNKSCLYDSVTGCDGYNDLTLIKSEAPYKEFLSYLKSFEKNCSSEKDDHEIFLVSEEELLMMQKISQNWKNAWYILNLHRKKVLMKSL